MATPKSNIIRLRLTDLEKADWQKAAGGARKLSEWIRSVCNAEVASTSEPLPLVVPVIPSSAPLILDDALRREVQEQGLEKSGLAAEIEQEASSGQCPRWMHHRPGVYCGACKKVIRK